LRRLGGGARFEVYSALDERRASTVVVKVIRPDQATDARALRDLRREHDALARLAHPVIVRAFGASFDGARPHLVLEHLDAPTLHRLVARHGPLPPEQLLPLASSLCSALHYMASEGFVHLDVKPRNVVMTASPRLIDLSVARTLERARRLTGRVGTRPYMAPEQCEPDGRVGPPADVWGLGMTLHRAVTGRRPFPDDGMPFPQLRLEPEPLPPSVPSVVRDAIAACLARDPAERPTALGVAWMLEPAIAALPRTPVLRRSRPR